MTAPQQPPGILDAALALHAAGLCPIPAIDDGTKAPHPGGPQWLAYQSTRSTPEQLRRWFDGTGWGLGVVGGAVSGGLVGLDVEGRALTEGVWTAYLDLATASGLGPVLARVAAGYTEMTASGGVHLLWRIDDGQGVASMKLAKRPATDTELAENPKDKFKTLIETKSEGGFLILAPTAGTVHPEHKAWVLAQGGPGTIATLTREESDALLDIARMLDQVPRTEPDVPMPRAGTPTEGERPGDDYENRTDWAEILRPAGWEHISTHGGTRYWRRPGKTVGISATTGHAADRDRLYVFTTSTEFTELKPYTKFAAYAVLEHGGDHAAAAKTLRGLGYGKAPEISPPPPKLRLVGEPATGPAQHPTQGATALATGRPTPVQVDPARYGPTEDGLARAVVDAHRQNIRYCPQRGQWLTWQGHRWSWDAPELVREHVRDLARALPDGEGWATFKKRALSAGGVTGVLRLAQSDPCVIVGIDDLDARPYELNTPAGIVDLHTGALRPPDPAALHTRCTAATPDFDRRGEVFETFLADTFAGNEDLTPFLQRILGIAAIGAVTEQILPFAHGEGANGKSTLIETVMAALGVGEAGYAIAAPAEMLMIRKHSEHPAEIAQLAGARLVVCSELEDGARFAESRIKQLTGRDSVNARFMRRDPFTFTPSHTLFLHGNHKPRTSAGGPAFWRRMLLIPFLNVVPKEKRDSHLGEKLAAELPAILAWICRGAADYSARGLGVPKLVTEATADYAHDQDSLGMFVEEMCHQAPGQSSVRVKAGALWSAYEAWCRSAGEDPVTQKRFATDLQARFKVASERTKAARFYAGIALLDDGEPVTEERYR